MRDEVEDMERAQSVQCCEIYAKGLRLYLNYNRKPWLGGYHVEKEEKQECIWETR